MLYRASKCMPLFLPCIFVVARIFSANWQQRISVLTNIRYAVTSRPFSKWDKVYTPWHPGGGALTYWKGVWGCAAVMTPFFQASRRSLAYQFTVNAPLLWPPFPICRNFFDFQPCFGQNSSSLDPNFSKFSFPRPPVFKENPLPRPYILKPAWHTSTKKKLSAPPPPPPRAWHTHLVSSGLVSLVQLHLAY